MSVQTIGREAVVEEPPLSPAAQFAAQASRALLIGLCAAPIALFPLGVAYKAYLHFFAG